MNVERLKHLRRSRSEVFMLKTWAYIKQNKCTVAVASAFIRFKIECEIIQASKVKIERSTLLPDDPSPTDSD